MGEDEIRAWVEGMYQRIYPKIPAGNMARFQTTYEMERGVVEGFMETVQAGIPMLEKMPETEAMEYLEWTFRIFMRGWGSALAWRDTLI